MKEQYRAVLTHSIPLWSYSPQKNRTVLWRNVEEYAAMNTFLTLLTGGGFVAAGGVLNAWLTNSLGARRDKRRYDHDQQMTREARSQDRLDRAYIELGMYLSRYGDWARSVQPFWGAVPAPDPLPPGERWRIEALVTEYGSKEVWRLLEEWGEHAAKIDAADDIIRRAERSRAADLDEEALRERQALDGYKAAMYTAADAIRDRMRRELAGEMRVPTLGSAPRRTLRRGLLGRRRVRAATGDAVRRALRPAPRTGQEAGS